jgi:hypothetical protein
MKHTLQIIIAALALMLLAGCNIGRGFRPPSDSNSLETWGHKSDINQQKINTAMLDCGYTSLTQGYGTDNSENSRVERTECMFRKNFYFNSGYGGVCSDPDRRLKLPACASAPLRSRNSYYGN